MENPIKMDDLGGKPTIFGNIHMNKLPVPPPLPTHEQKLHSSSPLEPCLAVDYTTTPTLRGRPWNVRTAKVSLKSGN